MQTTLSRESVLGDEFIKNACARNPIREHKDEKGKPTGVFFSGPVRLSFPHLFFPKHVAGDASKPARYSVQLNWPLCADMRPLHLAAARLVTDFQKVDIRQLNQANFTREKINGMATPFSDQGEKITDYSTVGAWRMGCSNERKPAIFLPGPGGKQIPCTSNDRPSDPNKGAAGLEWFYGGMWAIVGFRLYINKAVPQRSIPARLNASLESVLFFKDDKRFGAAQVNHAELLGAVDGIESVEIPGGEVYEPSMNGAMQQPADDSDWAKAMGLA